MDQNQPDDIQNQKIDQPISGMQVSEKPKTPAVGAGQAPKKQPHFVAVSVLIAALIFFGIGFWTGRNQGIASVKPTPTPVEPKIQVPANATIVSQCEPGEGVQFVEPKNIPGGPVYNVWQNKVVGLEYMVSKDDLINLNKDISNLTTMGAKFDHMNIGFVSHGHAGFPTPHYHIELFTIPESEANKIVCAGSNQSMDHMHM